MVVEIKIDEEMTKFMIRNILGHEPCHDFNPAGAGSRYVKLNKQLENVKIDGIYQEGGSGKGDSVYGEKASPEGSIFSFGEDSDTIDTYEDMKYDSPSTVFNRIAKYDLDEDQLVTVNPSPDNELNMFYSILGNNYNSFLNEFDVDANNMENILALNAEPIARATTRSITQLRSNTINGIQSTTEMTDYIRMYMFGYISGYTSGASASASAGAGLKLGGSYKGGKETQPSKNLMIEEGEEKNDGSLISIENNKKKENKIATLTTVDKYSKLKEGIKEGEPTAAEPTAALAAALEAPVEDYVEEGKSELKEGIQETTTPKLPDRYQEFSHLNNALTHIIKEFDEYDKLDDDALIDVWPIDTNISRPYLKETKNIFVFYQYIFNYYINNINNILSSYLINDSYFIRDAIFFFFINHFNSKEEKFLEITDEDKKKGILNEIFNLRIPEWSDDNKYLASIKKNKKEEIIEKTIASGQKGGDDDDEAILSLQIINMITSLGPVTLSFSDDSVPKTVTIGGVNITSQDQLITTLQDVYGGLINGLMAQILTEGNENYQVPSDFESIIPALQNQLIEEYVSNTKSKSFIQQLKPKRGMGSLFTLINNYKTGTGTSRAAIPQNLKNSINNAINTITTNLKARIIKLVSVTRYNKIKIQGTKTTSLSREAQVPVNMILQRVCETVNEIIGERRPNLDYAQYNTAADHNATDGNVFLTQQSIINKIATYGSTSDVDTKLYKGFRNWLNNNPNKMKQDKYTSVSVWNPDNLKKFIQLPTATKQVRVINNALSDKASNGDKMIKVLSDYRSATGVKIFYIKCPISSIFDAQGSFGSCNFGLNVNKSKNDGTSSNRHNATVITNNMDIEITGTNGFLITLSLTFTAKNSTKTSGLAILAYTITPGANYTDKGEYKIITGRINSIIRDEAIDILSAKTVFKDVFNNITSNLGLGNLSTYLSGAGAIHNIMSGLTQKFMGDFGQELNAIATNFGQGGVRDDSYYTLLADGDRPSFVRASLLRSLATSGIDPQSYLWYMSPKGGVAVGPRPPLPTELGKRKGGYKKKTKKKQNKKKRKNRKTNKKKSKTRKNKTKKNKRKMKRVKKTHKKK